MNDPREEEKIRKALGAADRIPDLPTTDAVFAAAVRQKLDANREAGAGLPGWRWALVTTGALAVFLTLFSVTVPSGTTPPLNPKAKALFSAALISMDEEDPFGALGNDTGSVDNAQLAALFSATLEDDPDLGEGALAALELDIVDVDSLDLLDDLDEEDLDAFARILDENMRL
jgi:hypothetical protein